MSRITDPAALERLVERLGALRPDAEAKWGTLTAREVLCHLGDATASILAPDETGGVVQGNRFMKWLGLRAPIAWPRGMPTPAAVDPQQGGTKPGDFDADRDRVVRTLRELAVAPAEAMLPSHGAFGLMTAPDWHRWAYRHTDHHLRQFGV